MKDILIMAPVDLSKNDGPMVHLFNLTREFKKYGGKLRCILYSPEDPNYGSLGSGIEIRFVPNPLLGSLGSRFLKYLFVIPIIMWELFRFKPSLLYFSFSPPAFLYLSVLKALKIFPFNFKVVIEFHDWVSEQRAIQGESESKVILIEFLQIKSARMADYIRVVARGIKNRLEYHGVNGKKIKVVENGTDIEFFKPVDKKEAKKEIGFNPDYLYVGFIGNFAIWQGLIYLVQAIPDVLKEVSNVRFLLVGDGPEMPRIRSEVSGFKNREVILTGSVPYRQADKYINAFDIGVAPFLKKRNDGMVSPMKIRDYAACGVPIVSSRIRGLEVIEEEDIGILIPPEDPTSLASAILMLSKDKDLRERMGKRGRKLAEEKFSWNLVTKEILELVF